MDNRSVQKVKDKEENTGDREEKETQLPGLSGNLFQLKILMFYLFKMLSSTSMRFLLGTEMKYAGKFDDLLLKYEKDVEGNKKNHFLLMQCKHKTGKNKILKPEEILNDGKADFALVKYFNSFVESKNSKMFENVEIEHVLVFTNAYFYMEWKISGKIEIWKKLVNMRNIVEEMDVKQDSVLSLCNIHGGKYFKFKSELVAPVLKELILNYPKKPENNLDDNIKEFLHKFVFAIGQPDERKLEKVISDEIRAKYPKYETDLIYNHFEKEIMNWLITGKFCIKKSEEMSESKFISSENAAEFFEKKIRKFDTMVLKGPIYDYDLYIRKYDIDFADLELENIIRTFFSSPTKKILNIVSDHIIITSIKLYMKLTNCSSEGLKEFVYVKLSSKLLDLAIDVFEKESTNRCLVLKLDFDETKLEKWTDKIDQIIGTILCYNEKKLIIISNRYDMLKKYFPTDMEHVETHDITNKLMDLKNESQVLFLNSKVKFQGDSDFKLSDFIINEELKQAIDGSILGKILKDECINIGKPIVGLKKDVQDCYIKRKFICKVENDTNIYLLSGIREDEIYLENYDFVINGILESLTFNESDAFKKEEKQNKSIYLLRKKSKKFILLKKSKLEDCFMKADFLNTVNYKRDRCEVNLISAEAGMGKSMLLSKLPRDIKKQNPKLWVVKFDLNAMSTELNKMKKFDKEINFDTVVNFLHHGAKHQDELEKEIFKHRLQEKNVVLCMDGFDEICPNYKSIVLKIIEVLINETKINNIWLATRPYASILNDMKSSFTNCCLKVYNIEPFTESNQKEYLEKLWRPSIENGKVYFERFVKDLFKGLNNNINRHRNQFLGIALHTMLIGVALKETFEKYQNTNTLEISAQQREELAAILGLSSLYREFVKRKWGIQSKEKNCWDLDIIAAKTAADILYAECENKIKLLALDTLLSENILNNILTKEEMKHLMKLKSELNEKGDGIGIVIQISDGKPLFVHQTFAEYFVAKFFVDNLKKDDEEASNIVEYFFNYMISEENAVICDFIDSILYDETVVCKNKYRKIVSKMDGKQLHFVLERKWRNIAEILIENEITLDYEENKITVFHLASYVKNLKSSSKPILSLIFEKTKCDTVALENIFCRYNDEFKNYFGTKYIPLINAIDSNTFENVKIIIEKFSKMSILNIWNCEDNIRQNILHYATCNVDDEILIYLLRELKNYPDKLRILLLGKNSYGVTPLDNTVINKDLRKFTIIWDVLKEEQNISKDVLWEENICGKNILYYATCNVNDEILNYLLEELKNYPDKLERLLLGRALNDKSPFDNIVINGSVGNFTLILNVLKNDPNFLKKVLWKENRSGENILHHATSNRDDGILIYLLEELKNYTDELKRLLLAKDYVDETPLDNTVKSESFKRFKFIWNVLTIDLNISKEDILWKENKHGENILHQAICNGDNEILIYLLQELKNYPEKLKGLLLGRDFVGKTPFHKTVVRSDLEKIKIIWNVLKEEQNILKLDVLWKPNKNGENILHCATCHYDDEILNYLLEELINYPEKMKELLLGRDRLGKSPFDNTVIKVDLEKIKIIWNVLKKEQNILKENILWKENKDGKNILHHATRNFTDLILIFLLEELINYPDILKKLLLGRDCYDDTPLDNAVINKDLKKIKVFWNVLKKEQHIIKEDILWKENKDGKNILHHATRKGDDEILIYLLEELINYPDNLKRLLLGRDCFDNTPLDNTVMYKDLRKFKIIWNVLTNELKISKDNDFLKENEWSENVVFSLSKLGFNIN